MKKVKGLKFYVEYLTAEKKYKLTQDSIYVAGHDPLKIQVHLNGRIFGKFLWDHSLCQKVCKALAIPKKDLTYKDEDGKTQLRLDYLTERFLEFTGYDSYWTNLQTILDKVASYNYGKQIKKYEYDDETNRSIDITRKQVDFRIIGALDLAVHQGVITNEEYCTRVKAIKNISMDEQLYVPCLEEPKKIRLNGRGSARFLKDRNSYLKVCRVLGITKKELFRVEEPQQLYNEDLIQSKFTELTGTEEYWGIVQELLDDVATYRYGKKKKYTYDQQTELEYQDHLEQVNQLFRDALNNALLEGRIDSKKYVARMEKLRAVFVAEMEDGKWKPLPEPEYLSSVAQNFQKEGSQEITQPKEDGMVLSIMSEEEKIRRNEDLKIAVTYGLISPSVFQEEEFIDSNKQLQLFK